MEQPDKFSNDEILKRVVIGFLFFTYLFIFIKIMYL
ncbi:hypothetical protein ADICEAN_00246 [Cesiribacter andamanensis AMV16]|uniref:Uncharacterized protein n=1 Tax=Cesiribacter andamanensis AMV16 TaxID=1279009 RepID=M7N7Q4_9BACT|nr:hypothetical protein ADICEAN_00246 [Cesiribacter andamanensis AMV16]